MRLMCTMNVTACVHGAGHNADYIPQLAAIDPDQFSISITTVDGQHMHNKTQHMQSVPTPPACCHHARSTHEGWLVPELACLESARGCWGSPRARHSMHSVHSGRINMDMDMVVAGQHYSIGDADTPFCIQSCSKPISYLIALNEFGADYVHDSIGTEPSGQKFNKMVLKDVGAMQYHVFAQLPVDSKFMARRAGILSEYS